MQRLVLMVEGDGDAAAVPGLVDHLLSDTRGKDILFIDGDCIKVGSPGKLTGDDFRFWRRMLGVAQRRPELGGVVLLLDGDADRLQGERFCAATVARRLATVARAARAGEAYSVAVTFACREYESWLIAGIESASGQPLAHARASVPRDVRSPGGNLEQFPRDAKGWLREQIGEYQPTLDQPALTRVVDFSVVERRMRSYQRFKNSILQIVEAVRTGRHVATPT